MNNAKKRAYRLGHFAEFVAVLWFLLKGYSIKERRYRSKQGEIDIIAAKKRTLVFCEVKARKNYLDAAEAITDKQKNKISKTAALYVTHLKSRYKNNKIRYEMFRYDVILIVPWRLPTHIKNAW